MFRTRPAQPPGRGSVSDGSGSPDACAARDTARRRGGGRCRRMKRRCGGWTRPRPRRTRSWRGISRRGPRGIWPPGGRTGISRRGTNDSGGSSWRSRRGPRRSIAGDGGSLRRMPGGGPGNRLRTLPRAGIPLTVGGAAPDRNPRTVGIARRICYTRHAGGN